MYGPARSEVVSRVRRLRAPELGLGPRLLHPRERKTRARGSSHPPRPHPPNIGISAHIDSGKTTLTERILYYTGRIHKIHEVRGKDGVGAKMDSIGSRAREGDHTIQSAATYCVWNGSEQQLQAHNINIIDTPGHVDFNDRSRAGPPRARRRRSSSCSTPGKGVQSESITVDRQMKRYRVPRIAFVNKMDNPGANYDRVSDMLKEKLGHHPVKLQVPMGAESAFKGIIDPIIGRAFYFDGDDGAVVRQEEIPAEYAAKAAEARTEIIHRVADVDDELAEKFLNEEPISTEELRSAIRRATLALKMTPVMCGSAIKNKGGFSSCSTRSSTTCPTRPRS